MKSNHLKKLYLHVLLAFTTCVLFLKSIDANLNLFPFSDPTVSFSPVDSDSSSLSYLTFAINDIDVFDAAKDIDACAEIELVERFAVDSLIFVTVDESLAFANASLLLDDCLLACNATYLNTSDECGVDNVYAVCGPTEDAVECLCAEQAACSYTPSTSDGTVSDAISLTCQDNLICTDYQLSPYSANADQTSLQCMQATDMTLSLLQFSYSSAIISDGLSDYEQLANVVYKIVNQAQNQSCFSSYTSEYSYDTVGGNMNVQLWIYNANTASAGCQNATILPSSVIDSINTNVYGFTFQSYALIDNNYPKSCVTLNLTYGFSSFECGSQCGVLCMPSESCSVNADCVQGAKCASVTNSTTHEKTLECVNAAAGLGIHFVHNLFINSVMILLGIILLQTILF